MDPAEHGTFTDEDILIPDGNAAPEAVDLVSDARQRCLAAQVLAETLVSTMEESGSIDEKSMALAYSVEEHVAAACEAVKRAGQALL